MSFNVLEPATFSLGFRSPVAFERKAREVS